MTTTDRSTVDVSTRFMLLNAFHFTFSLDPIVSTAIRRTNCMGPFGVGNRWKAGRLDSSALSSCGLAS